MAQYTGTPSLDGYLARLFQASWADAHGGAAITMDKTSDPFFARAEEPSTGTFHVTRGFLVFDLSSIPTGRTVSSATLAMETNLVGTPADKSKTMHIVESTQDSASDLVSTDYDNYNTTDLVTEIVLGTGINTTTFTFNSSGITYLEGVLGSDAMFCAIMEYDLEDTDPPVADTRVQVTASENGTAANRPTLTINYSDLGGAFLLNLI